MQMVSHLSWNNVTEQSWLINVPMYLLVIMEKSDQIWENNSFYKVKQKRELVTAMLACHLNIIIFYDQVYL